MGSSEFAAAAKRAGYEDITKAPIPLRRQVAKDAYCTHLVTGTVAYSAQGYDVQIEVHDVKKERLKAEFQLSAPSLYAVVDEASLRIRQHLGLPEEHLETWPDQPVIEIATASLTALESYAWAARARDMENDAARARWLLEEAIAEDPGFALAHWSLWFLLQVSSESNAQQAAAVLNTLMNHLYRLPERVEFSVKATYFQSQGAGDKASAVLRMWRDLYPYDLLPHQALLMLQSAQGDTDAVIASLLRLLELEPDNPDYLQQAGSELQRAGRFEAARGYFETYVERYPDDDQALVSLGSLLQTLGNHEEAKDYLEHAQLLNPADPHVRLELAECEFHLGDLTTWPSTAQSILEENLDADQRLQVVLELAEYYVLTGQLHLCNQLCRTSLQEVGAEASPLWSILTQVNLAEWLAGGGQEAEALALLDDILKNCPLPFRPLGLLAPISVHIELGNLEEAESAAADLESMIESLNLGLLRFKWMETMGRIREQQSDYEVALDFFQQRIDLSPTGSEAHLDIGRCHRKAGNLDQAEASLTLALSRSPYNPSILYEMALLADRQGERSRAVDHLERALEVWALADSAYAPVRKARDTLRSWQETS